MWRNISQGEEKVAELGVANRIVSTEGPVGRAAPKSAFLQGDRAVPIEVAYREVTLTDNVSSVLSLLLQDVV